jgi:hypothetical protein
VHIYETINVLLFVTYTSTDYVQKRERKINKQKLSSNIFTNLIIKELCFRNP